MTDGSSRPKDEPLHVQLRDKNVYEVISADIADLVVEIDLDHMVYPEAFNQHNSLI